MSPSQESSHAPFSQGAKQPLSNGDGLHLKDEPVENFRRMRVIVIGAGFSGIFMGVRIPEWLRNVDLTIYEKNAGVGGTWWENKYPGCACDIPAHSYVYTFEPNPNWSGFYASSEEIQQYLEGVCNKYSVHRFVKLRHRVDNCVWDETNLRWRVEVTELESGTTFVDEADVVVNARGGLNSYLWPNIDGLWSFGGKVVHSAAWDTSFDYANKRIGVIGGGSSAIQIVPQLQKLEGTDLTCFIRSKTWISQGFGQSAMDKLGLDHETFNDKDREKHMANPVRYHEFRKLIETEGNQMHPFSLKDSSVSKHAREIFTKIMRERLSGAPQLAEWIIPDFAPGCRRLTPGPGYLEALTEDNVTVIRRAIQKINPAGVELDDGQMVKLDVLVCATGFDAVGPPPFPVVGLNGATLQDRFTPYPEAYLSLAVDKFPNFFFMLGPNSGVASGSLTTIIENIGTYIVKCIRKLQKENILAMHISSQRLHDWVMFNKEYFKRTVFMDNCKTWYRRDNRIIGLWPGSTLHAIETLRSPRWEDFEYTYTKIKQDDEKVNQMAWMGNGWSELQQRNGNLAWYIEPEFVDNPGAPYPEKTERWMTLSFSH